MAFSWQFFTATVLLTTAIATASADGCVSGNIDAIVGTSDGAYYAFDAEYVSRLRSNGNSIEDGYPKLISEVFRGLPTHIDAAIYWPSNRKTYFFKGTQYWRFTGTTMDRGYPISIARGWPGLPDDLDAAIHFTSNGKSYFFRGSRYWRYDVASDRTDPGYPLAIEGRWGGYNDNVDAAFLWQNGYGYLFHGEQYWRYNIVKDVLDTTYAYPKATTKLWFGCSTNNADVDMAGAPLFN